jgi:hypothetical protein
MVAAERINTPSADVFAMGVVVFELLSRRAMWTRGDLWGHYRSVEIGN